MKPEDYTRIIGYSKAMDLLFERGCSGELKTYCGIVSSMAPKGAALLDIGGGSGLVLKSILAKRPDLSATLLEPSQEMLALARSRSAHFSIIESTLQSANKKLLLGKYDVITLCRSLYALFDGEQTSTDAIETISSTLKPYGLLAIHEPAQPYDVTSFESQAKTCLNPPEVFHQYWPAIRSALERFNEGVNGGEFTLYDATTLDCDTTTQRIYPQDQKWMFSCL